MRSVSELKQILDAKVKVILLDIEGTTTAITFVCDTLFPYAKSHLVKYLSENWGQTETDDVIEELILQSVEDRTKHGDEVPEISAAKTRSKKDDVIKSVSKYVLWQMSQNQKTPALKKLQGYIWRKGYKSGEIVGHVYDDVKPALQQFKDTEKKLYIYSSGSVEAQKLLFGHTNCGDMLSLFDGNFDTKIGDKKTSDSYRKIADSVDYDPSEFLFFTDIEQEAKAAMEVGMHACIVVRPGNKPLDEIDKYFSISDFTALLTNGP